MKKLFYFLLAILILLFGFMTFNTLTGDSLQLTDFPEPAPFSINEEAAIGRFASSLEYQTVSLESGVVAEEQFEMFHQFLESSFPDVFNRFEIRRVNDWTLWFTWEGSDRTLSPILLMAHQDVVPAESPDEWTHPPFSGTLENGVVWGRGAVDNKSGVMGILEAVQNLISEGFQPERTVHLLFGHDEEVGGLYGAQETAELFEQEGTQPFFVLDEGGYVTEGEIPLDRPLAVIGISEKGYLSLELVARSAGGHSSMPPRQTAIGILAEAISKLQNKPFPASVSGPAKDLFTFIAPEMSFGERLVLSNLWLTEPVVTRMFASTPASNAMLRTTIAPTMMQGSEKDNILPAEAKIVVNFRIKPGETVESVTDYVRNTIDDDRIELRNHRQHAVDPSPVSDPYSEQFGLIHQTVRQIYPDVYTAPFLMVAATDSRHFTGVSDHVYRFLPVQLNEQESESFHGIDEQLRTDIYLQAIRFYRQLLLNTAGMTQHAGDRD